MKKNLLTAGCLMGLALAVTCTTTTLAQTTPPPAGQTPVGNAAPGSAAAKLGTPIVLPEYTGPKYDNRWEVYGGLSFMNGQAGQNAPFKRYNMGGGEGELTYWLGTAQSSSFFKRHVGLTADYRFEAGTTPVISTYNINRVVVMQSVQSGGVQFRWLKNRYVALDLHGLAGGTYGIFNRATNNFPSQLIAACPAQQTPSQQGNLGLYCNHMAPWGAAGGSIDFNESRRLAVRLSPDMIFEHFGTETREYFSISLGVLWRFGKK